MKRYTLQVGENYTAFAESPEGEWVRWEDLTEFTLIAANHAVRMDQYRRALDSILEVLVDLEGFEIT
jgi:hypothetical protein